MKGIQSRHIHMTMSALQVTKQYKRSDIYRRTVLSQNRVSKRGTKNNPEWSKQNRTRERHLDHSSRTFSFEDLLVIAMSHSENLICNDLISIWYLDRSHRTTRMLGWYDQSNNWPMTTQLWWLQNLRHEQGKFFVSKNWSTVRRYGILVRQKTHCVHKTTCTV